MDYTAGPLRGLLMTEFAINANCLMAGLIRRRQYASKAIEQLGSLLAVLPTQGNLRHKFSYLRHAVDQADCQKSMAGVDAWANLVRGHALDFHADAGDNGTLWQHAVVDAWEMWLMLRLEGDPEAQWPWEWHGQGVEARGCEGVVLSEPRALLELSPASQAPVFSQLDINDWRSALEQRTASEAVIEAQALLEAWPKIDLPCLGIAMGAQWAISVAGTVSGFSSLEIGGVRGDTRWIETRWG
jgi:hypothetical protein